MISFPLDYKKMSGEKLIFSTPASRIYYNQFLMFSKGEESVVSLKNNIF